MSFFRCTSLAFLCAFAAGCGVTLEDLPGRACDETRACRRGRVCSAGRCIDETPDSGADAGGADASTFDAGPVDAGLDAGVDAGIDAGVGDAGVPVWQQRRHGFDGRTEGTGCTADVDPSRGNRVFATVLTTSAAEDFATADVTDTARLPAGFDGRLRGRIWLPVALVGRGTMPVVSLTDGTNPLIEIGFTPQAKLYVLTAANTVADSALFESFTRDGGFPAGDFVVEVAWRRGGTREVFLDGVRVAASALGPGSSTNAATSLRLGVVSTGMTGGSQFSVTLSGFQLADTPSVTFGGTP